MANITPPSALIAARPLVHPGYVVGNWHNPFASMSQSATSFSSASNFIFFVPFNVVQSVTLSDIVGRVTTAVAGGNFQLAIYASDSTTHKPTGSALASTGSLSTAAVATVSQTLGAPVTLPVGWYWAACNNDSTASTAAVQGLASSVVSAAAYVGSPTAANVFGGPTTPLGYRVAQTFGTWPSITPASVVEGNFPLPILGFKVSAVGA